MRAPKYQPKLNGARVDKDSRHVSGKQPSSMNIGIEAEKKREKLTKSFSVSKSVPIWRAVSVLKPT